MESKLFNISLRLGGRDKNGSALKEPDFIVAACEAFAAFAAL
jgi:hypothetical protein